MIAPPLPPPVGTDAISRGITAHAACEVRLSEIAALREAAPPLPPRFLRHCDEHTVVGAHAVLRALARLAGPAADVRRDAIVAASCQTGRLMAARSLSQLKTGGAVTVSTHIVPQASLHSLAGAVSVGLGMRGPHLGVGGGPDALAEGILAAVTLAADAPRTWLVVAEWDEEPALAADGTPAGDPLCRALALALEPGCHAPLTLDVRFPATPAPATPAAGQLAAFCRAVEMCGTGGALVSWTLATPWGAELRIARRLPAAHVPAVAGRLREAA